MFMSFSPPLKFFLLSIVLGSVFGICWDFNRVFKKNLKLKKMKKIFILDILFFIVACVLTLSFFNMFTYSGFRFFVLLGELIGFILYFYLISKPIFFVLEKIMKLTIKLSMILIYKPIIFFKKILNKISKKLSKVVRHKSKIIISKLKNIKIEKNNKKNTCRSTMDACIMKKINRFIKKNNL